MTVKLNIFALLFGLPGGLLLFAGRTTNERLLRYPATILIEAVKGIPSLVLMFWIYLCLPLISGIRLSADTAAIIALGFNYAANASEILRSSWGAVSLDLKQGLAFQGIQRSPALLVFKAPLLLRVSLPGLLAQFAATIKLSGIAAFIGVAEAFHAVQGVIQQTYRPVELYSALALFYLILVLFTSLVEIALVGKVRRETMSA